MEFKGTKGKWEIKKTKKGNYKISGDFWDGFCKIYTVKNVHEYETETEANALLISKAPEMLEMLQSFIYDFDKGLIEDFQIPRDRFEKLIKQATEL